MAQPITSSLCWRSLLTLQERVAVQHKIATFLWLLVKTTGRKVSEDLPQDVAGCEFRAWSLAKSKEDYHRIVNAGLHRIKQAYTFAHSCSWRCSCSQSLPSITCGKLHSQPFAKTVTTPAIMYEAKPLAIVVPTLERIFLKNGHDPSSAPLHKKAGVLKTTSVPRRRRFPVARSLKHTVRSTTDEAFIAEFVRSMVGSVLDDEPRDLAYRELAEFLVGR